MRFAFTIGFIVICSYSLLAQETYYAETSANDYIGIYQKYIGAIRGGECPMYPSCSNFGLKTFREVSFGQAMLFTSDRLIRCGHDHTNYALTFTPKGYKRLDFPSYAVFPDSLVINGRSTYIASGDYQKDDEDTEFVKWLINNGYFQEAVLEINRIFYRKDKFTPELFNNLLVALTAEDRLEEALFAYDKYSSEHNLSEDHEITYNIASIHRLLNNLALSNELIEGLIQAENTDHGLSARALSLKSVNQAEVYNWQGVVETNTKLYDYEILKLQAKANKAVAEEALLMKPKKPFLAGAFSALIPGLGYAYSGHFQTGVSALLVNGLLAFATYSSIRTENYGLAALTGIFNLTFYLGNISGSAKSAERYNQQKNRNFSNKIKNQSYF